MERRKSEERNGRRRRALLRAGAGLLLLIAGMVLGGFARPGLCTAFFVTAGYLGLVLCARGALLTWNAGPPGQEDSAESSVENGRPRPASHRARSSGGRSGAIRLSG